MVHTTTVTDWEQILDIIDNQIEYPFGDWYEDDGGHFETVRLKDGRIAHIHYSAMTEDEIEAGNYLEHLDRIDIEEASL